MPDTVIIPRDNGIRGSVGYGCPRPSRCDDHGDVVMSTARDGLTVFAEKRQSIWKAP